MADELPEYTREEEAEIVNNHLGLAREVHQGAWRGRPLERELLCALHERLFEDVREHAGRHRDRGRGQEYITFGDPRRRSVARDHVARELDNLCAQIRRRLDACRRSRDDADYEAVELAVWAQVELLRIHPFEDGNGRTARLLTNLLLVELDLMSVPTEVPREEYLAALRAHDTHGDLEPLVDLYLVQLAAALPDEVTST